MLLRSLTDLVAPRACLVCGRKLQPDEDMLCGRCFAALPHTHFADCAERNEMAELFYGLLPIRRAAALFFYQEHTPRTHPLFSLKYRHNADVGLWLGQAMAREFGTDFFDGIDSIVPVPITKSRERERGYNQSLLLAQGMAEATGLKVRGDCVRRVTFGGSNTRRDRWSRYVNVSEGFKLAAPAVTSHLRGEHVLIVDDVVTTGATMKAVGLELLAADVGAVSVASVAFVTHSHIL